MNHLKQAHLELEYIFRSLLPQKGLAVREGQIELCHTMLDTLLNKGIALCDAGVGVGKTYAYLTACVLLDKFFSQPGQESIVISTSSIALQNALFQEYIPFLSQLFLEKQILCKPLQAVIRKGKQHFVCDLRLQARLEGMSKNKNEAQKKALYALRAQLDMDNVPGLSHFDQRLVSIPQSCPKTCILKDRCRYHQYLIQARSPEIFIQICNHNYLLADANHRMQGIKTLLKEYAIVIDEAHKLPDAAGQMNDLQFSKETVDKLFALLAKEDCFAMAIGLREKLQSLLALFPEDQSLSHQQPPFTPSPAQTKAFRDCLTTLRSFKQRKLPLSPYTVSQLEEAEHMLTVFSRGDRRYILYLQYNSSGVPILCAASRDLSVQLWQSLWEQNLPAILTSGTLAAGGSFDYARETLGLADRKTVTCLVPSPFLYEENCLLYFPSAPSRAAMGTTSEITNLARHIGQLIAATYGHTLILFTSYSLMNGVCSQIKDCLSFPLFVVQRHTENGIHQFKAAQNGVLCAAGSCWEGMDFPGNQVSSLIIPRLPFPTPNPVSRKEQEAYSSLAEYIQAVVVPDMQKKLRQGFGRAIRKETDSCTISILDPRAAPGQRYHQAVLDALPIMPITQDISQVEAFIRRKKGPEYFASEGSI